MLTINNRHPGEKAGIPQARHHGKVQRWPDRRLAQGTTMG